MGLGNAIGIGIPMVNLGLGGGSEPVEERFVISVKTDNAGTSADNQYTLGWIGTYDVDWGDGNTDLGVVDFQTHTYTSPGTYEIKVKATTGRWAIGNGGDRDKNIDILNWGTCAWTSMAGTLNTWRGNKNITATDIPNLTQCTDMSNMFQRAHFETINLVGWDVSSVTNMYNMFREVANFAAYDPIIDISGWDISNCTNIRYMFNNFGKLGPTGHDGYIGDISNWDTGNVVLMDRFASSDIIAGPNFTAANWDITNVISAIEIGINQTIENYDATLINFASQSPNSNLVCNFGTNQYSYEAAAARQTLIDTYGWTITDGGQVAAPEFALKWETTTPNEEIQIGVGSGTFDYTIDWGDGTVESYNTDANISHTYATAGFHVTKITGDFPSFLNLKNTVFESKLKDVLNWGNQIFEVLGFQKSYGLSVLSATDYPNLSSNGVSFHFGFNRTNLISGLENWDTTNITDVSYMFNNANSVNMSFANWNVEGVNGFNNFTASATLSTANYDATLISWAAQNVGLNKGINFGSSQYTLGGAAEAARNTLINTYGWTITDGGGI